MKALFPNFCDTLEYIQFPLLKEAYYHIYLKPITNDVGKLIFCSLRRILNWINFFRKCWKTKKSFM